MSGSETEDSGWETECMKFAELVELNLRLAPMPAGPDKVSAHSQFKTRSQAWLDGPEMAPLSAEQKRILLRTLSMRMGSYCDEILADCRQQARKARATLEEQLRRLQVDSDALRTELRDLQAQARRGADGEIVIDADVIAYAGLFDRALRRGEDMTGELGANARDLWRCMRSHAHEIFCTQSVRYAAVRKVARAASPLAVLVLVQAILEHYDLPVKQADAYGRMFLSVCDAGREWWCTHYNPEVLASPEELAKLREISERTPARDPGV